MEPNLRTGVGETTTGAALHSLGKRDKVAAIRGKLCQRATRSLPRRRVTLGRGQSRSIMRLKSGGWLKLVRILDKGKEKGVTLIPYEAVAAFVRAQMEAQDR